MTRRTNTPALATLLLGTAFGVVMTPELAEAQRTSPSQSASQASRAPRLFQQLGQRVDRWLGNFRAGLRYANQERLQPRLDIARGRLGPRVETARSRLGPRVETARGRLGPRLEIVRSRFGPRAEIARSRFQEGLAPVTSRLSDTGRVVWQNIRSRAFWGSYLRDMLFLPH